MSYIIIEPFDGWYDSTIEDFCDTILPHFGVDVSYKDVEFTGFWSQGDGASFKGSFNLSDVSLTDLEASVPTEVALLKLAAELQVLADAHPTIHGHVSRMSSRYSHSNTMCIGEYSSNNGYCNEETEAFAAAGAEASLLKIFRQLADWLYERLDSAYDFYRADATASQWAEAVEERESLQAEFVRLQVDVAENPPQSLIQSNALTAAIAALEVEIEELTSKIDQLSTQFSYWPKGGGPFTVEQFYENYF